MAFFPVILPWFPCYARNGSLLFAIGNIPKILMNAALLDDAGVFQRAFLWFSLYFFPVIEKIRVRDRFDCDWLRHHAVLHKQRFRGWARIAPNWRDSCASFVSVIC
jgi:hypothetical protein